MNRCDNDRRHRATGYYQLAVSKAAVHLCEVCAEQFSPPPVILYPLRERD